MIETEAVWLSDLKFAGLKLPQTSKTGIPVTDSDPPAIGSQIPTSSATRSCNYIRQPPPNGIGPRPHERIAAEKPGEELAPDAAIWEMYVEEANEQDNELVDGKNRNLDQMLLFATLFSAILTAFIIESKNLLQQDSAELTATLLLAIAQSQQRVEQGTPQTLPPIERPLFSAPMSARWINGLWYMSLALSLSSALIAMLAKEWLGSFLASRPRSPHAYALLHQTRLQNLIQWKALHILDLLPGMLHLSLLLFSLGLMVYLQSLDSGAALAVIVTTTITLLFYLGTALLGALRESCPFKTQFSKYLRIIIDQFSTSHRPSSRSDDITDTKPSDYTTNNELSALVWLAKNARDPALGDCAYQALAGLRVPPALTVKPDHPRAENATPDIRTSTLKSDRLAGILRGKHQSGESDDHAISYAILVGMCDAICMRLKQAISCQPRDLTACLGTNVAQYASALPMLVRFTEKFIRATPSVNNSRRLKSLQTAKSYAQPAFDALDSIWSDECPELHPDSYAMLAGANLRVIEAVTSTQHPEYDVSSMDDATRSIGEVSRSRLFDHSAIQISDLPNSQSMVHTEPIENTSNVEKISLFDLRARYSRVLARTGVLLSQHNEGQAQISPHPLTYLFDSVQLAAQCAKLNPESCLSTHQPQQRSVNKLPNFCVSVIGTGCCREYQALRIGDQDGLLTGLVKVLSGADIEATPWIEYAAGRTLGIIGPMLLRQWLQTQDDDLRIYLQKQSLALERVNLALNHWPKILEANELAALPNWTLKQLLVLTIILVAFADNPCMNDLPQVAASALNRRANMASARNCIQGVPIGAPWLIRDLIYVIQLNHQHLNRTVYDSLLRFFLVETSWTGRSIFLDRAVPWASLPHFLHCLSNWPGNVSEVQTILTELRELLQEDIDRAIPIYSYIDAFVSLSEGFTSLASLSQLPEYAAITFECIKTVVHFAVVNIRTYSLAYGAFSWVVPGLLDCVSVVLKGTPHDAENILPILTFLRDVIDLIDSINVEGIIMAANHDAMSEIEAVMAEPHEPFQGFADMVAGFEGIRARADLCGWLMGMRSRLFDEAEPDRDEFESCWRQV